MTASRLKILSVRLPEPQLRRIKSLAAQRGASLQEAVREALESWEATQPGAGRFDAALWTFAGASAGVGPTETKRRERAFEASRDDRHLRRS